MTTSDQYILKQWTALKTHSDWLVKLRISFATCIYLQATREKMAPQFVSVTSEEFVQINFCGVYYLTVFSSQRWISTSLLRGLVNIYLHFGEQLLLICHYLQLFTTIRTIRDYLHYSKTYYSLFTTFHYSLHVFRFASHPYIRTQSSISHYLLLSLVGRDTHKYFYRLQINVLMPLVCSKPIMWYFEMHHARTFFF